MQKPDKRAIGERIRKHREELNMSREQLSEIMGITSKFLSDIEFGLRGFSIEKLFLFSESLNLSTEYILFGTGPSINDRIFLQSINKCPEEKKEYLLPKIIDQLLAEKRAGVTLLETPDKWFGVTYKEDKPLVVEAIRGLIEARVY